LNHRQYTFRWFYDFFLKLLKNPKKILAEISLLLPKFSTFENLNKSCVFKFILYLVCKTTKYENKSGGGRKSAKINSPDLDSYENIKT